MPSTMETRTAHTLLRHLRELIAALDRRVSRLERDGERAIVQDAHMMRRAALSRIAELEGSAAVPPIGQ